MHVCGSIKWKSRSIISSAGSTGMLPKQFTISKDTKTLPPVSGMRRIRFKNSFEFLMPYFDLNVLIKLNYSDYTFELLRDFQRFYS